MNDLLIINQIYIYFLYIPQFFLQYIDLDQTAFEFNMWYNIDVLMCTCIVYIVLFSSAYTYIYIKYSKTEYINIRLHIAVRQAYLPKTTNDENIR